jgi:hypothetical protein
VFSKDDFEQRVSGAIANWWLGHGRSIKDLQGAQLRIWLTLPESSPSAASGRVEVWSIAGNFTLSFDLLAGEWTFVDGNAGLLGMNATYPKSYGWRPHDILLSLEAGVGIADVEDTIRSLNLELIGLVSPGWYHLKTEFFKEQLSVEALRSDGRLVHKIRSVQLNNLTEWIGYRGSGIQFKWREK